MGMNAEPKVNADAGVKQQLVQKEIELELERERGEANREVVQRCIADRTRLLKERNAAYQERNLMLSLMCKVLSRSVIGPGCRHIGEVFLAKHQPKDDPDWDPEWRNVVVIEKVGRHRCQWSWHIHDSELELFDFLPVRDDWVYDGHTTNEKYQEIKDF